MSRKDGGDEPPYLRIAGHFRSLIDNGELAPGARLPTLREIASSFSVARPTADKALRLLRSEGLVTTAGRGGTMVASDVAPATMVIAVQEPLGIEVTDATVTRASESVAADLGIQPGSAVIVVRLDRATPG